MKRFLLPAACLLVALAGANALAQSAPIVIRFSHVVGADTPKGRAAELFRMRAEELTKGRVRVEVHHNASLFQDSTEVAAMQAGQVEMLAPSLSKFGPIGVREFEIFDTPYLFADRRMLQKVLAGPVGRALFDKLAAHNIQGLAFWDNGFKVMSSNRPLNGPADMRGIGVRIQGSKILEAQMRTLGAAPQVMSLTEAFTALQSGRIDGTENPPSNLYSQRLSEVQKFVVATNHGYLGYAVIANKRFWDGLPADIRSQLEVALRDATRYGNSIAQQVNDDALAVVERSGRTRVLRLDAAQRKVWEQALAPVRKDAEVLVGRDFMALVTRELQAAGNR